jgi:predicted DNA-binding transcriptional regulator AlpA
MVRKPRPTGTIDANSVPAVPTDQCEILTVAEVAALLKVPVSSVYEWTRFRGTQRVPLPHRKIGKYLGFFRSEIDTWLVGLPQTRNTKKRAYNKKDAPAVASPVKA